MLDAIRIGETLVRDGGMVYLFAGLNTADQAAMYPANVFLYERLHRSEKNMLTLTPLCQPDKTIHYSGHSGYFEELAPQAIAAVATHAAELDRAVTGVIRGWPSPRIESRLPGGADRVTPDSSPAIISVLNGLDLRDHHCKLLMFVGKWRVAPSGLTWAAASSPYSGDQSKTTRSFPTVYRK